MEFEEIKRLRKVFDKYLNYKEINLWELSEWGLYPLLKTPKKESFVEDIKNRISRILIQISNRKREIFSKKNLNQTEIIMLADNSIHVSTFYPILTKIKNAKIIRKDPAFFSNTKKSLEKNDTPYTDIDSYLTPNVKRNLKEAEKWLNKQWKMIQKDLKKGLGENYKDIIEVLRYYMNTRKKYLDMIRDIELLNEMYDQEKNKMIILAEELNPLSRVAIIIAKKKKIKTFVIQHGTVLGDAIFKEVLADKTIVSGNREKNFLISMGTNPKKISAIGQPRFDKIKQKTKEEACKEIGLDSEKKVIVFAAQYLVGGQEIPIKNGLEEFLETIKKIPDKKNFEFIIKPHPNMDKKELYKKVKSTNVKIIENVELYSLLSACDILITSSSMVAIETVLLNRPVITIEIGGRYNLTNYEEDGVGISIYEKDHLVESINKILYNQEFKEKFKKSRKKFIKDFAYKLDGKTAERIANLINNLLKTEI